MEGLAATTDQVKMDVVSNKGDHSGPVELMMDVLDCLSDAQVASEAMVVVGAKDINWTS